MLVSRHAVAKVPGNVPKCHAVFSPLEQILIHLNKSPTQGQGVIVAWHPANSGILTVVRSCFERATIKHTTDVSCYLVFIKSGIYNFCYKIILRMHKLIKHLSLTNYKNRELFSVYICWQYWLKYDTPIIFIQFLHNSKTENVSNPAPVKKSVIYTLACVGLNHPVQVYHTRDQWSKGLIMSFKHEDWRCECITPEIWHHLLINEMAFNGT